MRNWRMRKLYIFLVLWSVFSCTREVQEKQNGLHHTASGSFASVRNSDSLPVLLNFFKKDLNKEDTALAELYYQAGMRAYQLSDYELADAFFLQAGDLFLQNKKEKKAIQMLSNQAVLKEMQGDYSAAVKLYLQALDYYKSRQDSVPMAKVYANLGVLYEEIELPGKALEYYRKALVLRQKTGDKPGIANLYNNIGVLYEELSGQTDSAIRYYEKAYQIYRRDSQNLRRTATVLGNMGKIYADQNKYDLAAKALVEAEKIFDSLQSKSGLANIFRNEGELFAAQQQFEKAKKYYLKSFQLFASLREQKATLEALELLSQIHLITGDYVHAARYLSQYKRLKDSLLSEEKAKLVVELDNKYQLKEKNKTIKILELQNQLNRRKIRFQYIFISAISVISLLIVLLFVINYRKNKLQQSKMRLELQNYLLKEEQNRKSGEQKRQKERESIAKRYEQYELTEREIEVLQLIAKGYKNAEIAEALFLSLNTIKTHIKNIYIKLDVKNRIEALKKMDL